MTDDIQAFGVAAPGAEYALRPGGYAIVVGPGGAVAVLRCPGGLYLPGGGQEPGETPEQAAAREAHEEAGLRVAGLWPVGVADELAWGAAEGMHFRKRCSFFLATLTAADGPCEPGYELLWLPADEARASLSHGSQRWALAEACRRYGVGLDARAAWNAGAAAYAHFLDSGADHYRHLVHGPGLLAACGDVAGLDALDLGAGHGYFSRLLARAGARVTGVELSDALHALAVERDAAEPLGVRYLRLDATRIGEAFATESFALVTGCMSLQDMADPAAVLAASCRVLRPGGRAVFSVPHPCTDTPTRRWARDGSGRKEALVLARYFETGPAVCSWDMPRLVAHWRTPYRRFTLTEWSAMIHAAGLSIRSLTEPRPDPALVARRPELEDCALMPYFLVFELVKAA